MVHRTDRISVIFLRNFCYSLSEFRSYFWRISVKFRLYFGWFFKFRFIFLREFGYTFSEFRSYFWGNSDEFRGDFGWFLEKYFFLKNQFYLIFMKKLIWKSEYVPKFSQSFVRLWCISFKGGRGLNICNCLKQRENFYMNILCQCCEGVKKFIFLVDVISEQKVLSSPMSVIKIFLEGGGGFNNFYFGPR